MDPSSSVSTLLKRYRRAAGLSQEALAARTGLSARAISNLERGINRTPRYATLELLTSALALSAPQRDLLLAAARPELVATDDTRADGSVVGPPLPPTRLIGRGAERAQALSLLRDDETHLLTLTGPSGVGKTRLALQLAYDVAPDFDDAVVYVPLAPIQSAALVPGMVAQALGIHERADILLVEQVCTFLRPRRLLLVLDNVEHLLDCAPFVTALLERSPHLRMLITSRIPLHVRAEREMLLTALPLGDAVTLFRERAQAIRPGTADVESEVAAVCRQVDCLPLAIELAAMHVKVLALPELRKQLTQRLALLRGGPRDLPVRQQTMEDAIAWSYELLTPPQQRAFRALSVFVGGWTLAAAQDVCWQDGAPQPDEAIMTLAALVDASLIHTEMLASGVVRFHMLELVRDYAVQRLRTAGEEEPCFRAHAAYFARLAETVMAYFGPDAGMREAHLVATWTQDLPNARAALQWADERQEAELGLRLTGFARLWHVRGQMSEAEHWFERMLDLDRRAREQGLPTAPLTERIGRLYGLGRTMVRHGKAGAAAHAAASEALRLADQIGDDAGVSNACATLGMIAQAQGRLDEAEVAYIRSHQQAALAGQRGLQCRALFHLADLAAMRGDMTHAAALLDKGRTLVQAAGMIWDIPIFTTLMGHLAHQRRDYTLAKAYYREALTQYRLFGSLTYTARCLEAYAVTLCAEGDYAQATRFVAAATTLRDVTQTALLPAEHATVEQVVAAARAALDEHTFGAEWAVGSRYTHDEAITAVLADGPG